LSSLADVAVGRVLTSGGVGVAPVYSATPTLGAVGTTLGTLSLAGNTSGVITIQPQAAAGTYNFNLPTTAGAAGQVLTSGGGAGAPMTWSAAGGGGWGLTGNAGTDGGATNFIGTTDNKAFSIRVFNSKSGLIDPAGPTFFGYQAGKVNTDVKATAIGYQALMTNTGGTFNTAVGYQALLLANGVTPNGSANTGLGAWALQANTSGGQNTAVGTDAMYSNISGMGNTALGYQAMYFCGACGFSNDMVLGSDIGIFMTPTASNQVWIGDNGITSIKGQVAYAVYSDARIKNNVQENVPGLAFVKELRPVTYNYDYNKEVEIKGGKKTADWEGKYDIEKIKFSGFIAQEVEAAANKIGYDFSGVDKPKSQNDLYSLRYSDFVVPLVKSVQELDTENQELKTKMARLSEDNKEMKAELDKIKLLLAANNIK
jgi:hypothetical protein